MGSSSSASYKANFIAGESESGVDLGLRSTTMKKSSLTQLDNNVNLEATRHCGIRMPGLQMDKK